MLKDSEAKSTKGGLICYYLPLCLLCEYCYHMKNKDVGQAQILSILSSVQILQSKTNTITIVNGIHVPIEASGNLYGLPKILYYGKRS
jgi:hypothetical protein